MPNNIATIITMFPTYITKKLKTKTKGDFLTRKFSSSGRASDEQTLNVNVKMNKELGNCGQVL